jgi:hypothetical protein
MGGAQAPSVLRSIEKKRERRREKRIKIIIGKRRGWKKGTGLSPQLGNP